MPSRKVAQMGGAHPDPPPQLGAREILIVSQPAAHHYVPLSAARRFILDAEANSMYYARTSEHLLRERLIMPNLSPLASAATRFQMHASGAQDMLYAAAQP